MGRPRGPRSPDHAGAAPSGARTSCRGSRHGHGPRANALVPTDITHSHMNTMKQLFVWTVGFIIIVLHIFFHKLIAMISDFLKLIHN